MTYSSDFLTLLKNVKKVFNLTTTSYQNIYAEAEPFSGTSDYFNRLFSYESPFKTVDCAFHLNSTQYKVQKLLGCLYFYKPPRLRY